MGHTLGKCVEYSKSPVGTLDYIYIPSQQQFRLIFYWGGGWRVTEQQSCKVTELKSYLVAELQNIRVAEVGSCRIREVQDCIVA